MATRENKEKEREREREIDTMKIRSISSSRNHDIGLTYSRRCGVYCISPSVGFVMVARFHIKCDGKIAGAHS